MTRVVGLGAGGHARVVIEILQLTAGVELVALLDPRKELWGSRLLGVPVAGGDDRLTALYDDGVTHAFIGLGSIGDTAPRRGLYERALGHGFEVVAAIHPQAVVSPTAQIGFGPTIMATAVVNSSARLGDDVVVNTGAVVEHDCVLGDHVFVATGARLASGVSVGAGAHIGVGASVRQGITIGRGALVATGAAVVADVAEDTVVGGVPAKPLRSAKR